MEDIARLLEKDGRMGFVQHIKNAMELLTDHAAAIASLRAELEYVLSSNAEFVRVEERLLARTLEAETRAEAAESALAERAKDAERVAAGVRGECIEAGNDDDGQPRILIHTTTDALRAGPALVYRNVIVLPAIDQAIADATTPDPARE
ncbi:MAG: hypothetical protein ACREO3_00995 [Arenimonas sp.]